MKTNMLRYAFSLLAVLAAVVSCGEKQPEGGQDKPESAKPVFPTTIVNETVTAGQSVNLTFNANLEWKVEISGDGKGNIFWLDDAGKKATSISSKKTGSQTVTVVFSENEEFDKNRVCEVTLSMGGESKKIATYTRPSLGRTFEVYAGIPGEFEFNKVSGAYAYTEAVVSQASLATFPGDVTYVLPLKVVTNYSWQLIPPSWISCETMTGEAGTTEIVIEADLSADIADGAVEKLRFADASNPSAAFEVDLTMPAFRDRIELMMGTTFNFDVNGLVENVNGTFIEIPAFFELLSTPEAQVKVVDWDEKGQYHGTAFSEWVQVTRELYDDFSETDQLAKYTVEFRVPANETYDDKYADVFVIPASKASVKFDEWFDPDTGSLKEEFTSYIVGRISQAGIERDYITLSDTDEVFEAELAKYTEAQWWADDLNTENLFELVYKNEHSDAVLVFDEPFASFKYFDYDFVEVPEEDVEDFWLSFAGFSSNEKGRVTIYPERFTRTDAEFPESFIVFYDEEGNVLGALSCRYANQSSVVTGDVIAMKSGNAELITLGEDSDMKNYLSSEYGNMGKLDVYQLATSDRNITFTSKIEAYDHKILNAASSAPFPEYTDAPFAFDNMADTFGLSMRDDVNEKVEAVILLKAPGADGVTLLNFVAIHYIYTPSEGGDEPENPGDGGQDSEFDHKSPMIYSIGAGSGELLKYSAISERYKAVYEKYGVEEVYLLTTGDRHVFITGSESLNDLSQLDPVTLEASSGTDKIVFEGSDNGFNVYFKGTENAEALVLTEGTDGYTAAIFVVYDFSIGIPSPFKFTNPSEVEGLATLARCEGDRLAEALTMFETNANFDERNIYELKYSDTSVVAEITVPSAPAFGAAWGNESSSKQYWLTHKMSGSKMTVTMKQSGLTDYFVFRTTDGNWAWVLVCTCE